MALSKKKYNIKRCTDKENNSPCEEERLIQLVNNVKNDVIISHHIQSRSRKLTIDKNHLQFKNFQKPEGNKIQTEIHIFQKHQQI